MTIDLPTTSAPVDLPIICAPCGALLPSERVESARFESGGISVSLFYVTVLSDGGSCLTVADDSVTIGKDGGGVLITVNESGDIVHRCGTYA